MKINPKLWIFLPAIFLMSCEEDLPRMPEGRAIHGIAGPIGISGDTSEVFLEDFIPGKGRVDSVIFLGKRLEITDDRVWPVVPQEQGNWITLELWCEGSGYTVVGSRQSAVSGQRSAAGTMQSDEISQQSAVSSRQQTIKEEKRFSIFPVGFEEGQVILKIEGKLKYAIVLWQNFRLGDQFVEIEDHEMEIAIPTEAIEMERSYIRVFAEDVEGNCSDVLVPLHYWKPLRDPEDLGRSDLHGAVIYNVFVDRFFNGDSTNDRPLKRPDVHPRVDYQGGDLAGVLKKLEDGYFDSLGVNTLWISPVVLNPSGPYGQWKTPPTKFSGYHGYWPISFTRTDPRYTTPEILKSLTDRAHGHDLNVLLDYVAHHVHQEHPYYLEHPSWVTPLYLPDGSRNTERWDDHRLTTWFDDFLPTLDLQQPELTEMLTDSAVWWIKTYDLDGFRHDAIKHIPEHFQRRLTLKLKQLVAPGEPAPFQIGETYGNPRLISSYIGPGMLDGQFDFNVYDAAISAFGRETGSFAELDEVLHQSFEFYGLHNLMGYITGNQDRARFISYAGGSLGWDENSKQAGWDRDIGVGEPVGYARLSMLTAFIMTIPGIPVIFYGDEIGIPGANDPDSRRMMRFDGLSQEEEKVFETAKKLIGLRRNHLALIYGDFNTLLAEDQSYAYQRRYFDDLVVVVFNQSNFTRELAVTVGKGLKKPVLTGTFGHPGTVGNGILKVTLPPYSFEIFVPATAHR